MWDTLEHQLYIFPQTIFPAIHWAPITCIPLYQWNSIVVFVILWFGHMRPKSDLPIVSLTGNLAGIVSLFFILGFIYELYSSVVVSSLGKGLTSTCFVKRSTLLVVVVLDLFCALTGIFSLTGSICVALLKHGFGIQTWIPVGQIFEYTHKQVLFTFVVFMRHDNKVFQRIYYLHCTWHCKQII